MPRLSSADTEFIEATAETSAGAGPALAHQSLQRPTGEASGHPSHSRSFDTWRAQKLAEAQTASMLFWSEHKLRYHIFHPISRDRDCNVCLYCWESEEHPTHQIFTMR